MPRIFDRSNLTAPTILAMGWFYVRIIIAHLTLVCIRSIRNPTRLGIGRTVRTKNSWGSILIRYATWISIPTRTLLPGIGIFGMQIKHELSFLLQRGKSSAQQPSSI
jgi:hypothetical protein